MYKAAIFPSYRIEGGRVKSEMIPESIIESARNGDAAALEEVLEYVSDFIWNFVGSHIDNDVDADEVAQASLVRVWRYLPEGKAPIRNFNAWISKIVWSQINEYWRNKGRDMEIPMSSIFYDHKSKRPLTYDEIEEGEHTEARISYGPQAARELAEADRIFRVGWRERPRQRFLKHPERRVI